MSECTSKCCELSHQGSNYPTCSKVLAGTKRYQGSGKSRQARQLGSIAIHCYHSVSLGRSCFVFTVVLQVIVN